MADMPPRDATEQALAGLADFGRRIDIAFDIDLGELACGHHVVVRGIELADEGAVLHYEFVPGMTARESAAGPLAWYWTVYATDDAGTDYDDYNAGAFDRPGGPASHGERDLGGIVPSAARRLDLRFEPPESWTPPGPWRQHLALDLASRTVVGDG